MFLRLSILSAGLMSAFIATAYAAETPLTGADLKTFFTSGKLQYTSGDVIKTLEYNPNGSAEQFNDDGSVNKGKWKVQGNRYCTIWPSRKNWKCFSVVRMDDGRFGDVESGKVTGYFSRQ